MRDRAIITVLLFTALRLAELAALNTGDAAISAGKGFVMVRHGQGDRYRQVPLNAEVRAALDAWLAGWLQATFLAATDRRCSWP